MEALRDKKFTQDSSVGLWDCMSSQPAQALLAPTLTPGWSDILSQVEPLIYRWSCLPSKEG